MISLVVNKAVVVGYNINQLYEPDDKYKDLIMILFIVIKIEFIFDLMLIFFC